MAKKTYVIDTSVFLSDANALYRFKNNDIVIPIKVLEEIDKHKKRQDSVGFHARQIIKTFDALRKQGNLKKGVFLSFWGLFLLTFPQIVEKLIKSTLFLN